MSLTIREEKILEAAIAGEQSPIEPVTRREAIFTKATGADIDLPPARNKEEDILSKLAVGYSGGGGVTDISIITVKFRTSVSGNYSEYHIDPYQASDEPDYVGAFVITPDSGVQYLNLQASPDYEYPIDMEIYLLSGRYILIAEINSGAAADYIITGNAEIITINDVLYVKVTGDCTITTVGSPYQ